MPQFSDPPDFKHDSQLHAALSQLATGRSLPLDFLTAHWCAQPQSAWVTSVQAETPGAVRSTVEAYASRFRAVYPVLEPFCRQLGWEPFPLELLWQLWLPLAMQLVSWHQQLNQPGAVQRPLIQGILGGQGSGKTTLAAILSRILQQWGFQLCSISIDDLYLPYADRLQLQQQDSRFRWRGPPGTHDVPLGLAVLQQLRSGQFPVAVPRFDKSAWQGMGDRTTPETIAHADIVLFEGWFVGVRPVDAAAFETAPSPINTAADRDFARKVNANLLAYLPLWALLDRLLILKPTDYRFSQQWRKQAERHRIASGRSGMSDAEIEQFVEYFWRSLHPDLFITPLLPQADLVIEIEADHQPVAIHRPLL